MFDSRPEMSMTYHGTTTVGIACSGGAVLATDTRVTAGYLFIAHKRGKKIHRIDDHLGITIAGNVADAQNVIDILRYHARMYKLEHRTPIPVRAAARLVSNVFSSARLFPYIADIIVAGFDTSGAAIFNVDLFGSLNQEKYHSTGSGSPVAFGVLESQFKEDLTIDEGAKLAVKAVTAAMKRNAGTGDSFDVALIDANGYKELLEHEKESILASVSRRD